MALELPGDEAVLGADEMQHLDDRAVGRHGAAGRERHRQHGGGEHQREHGEAGRHRVPRHGAHAVDPAAMIVEGGARRPARPAAGARPAKSGGAPDASLTTIRRGTGSSSSASPLPSQGSSSRADSSLRIGAHVGDAGVARAIVGRLAHVGFEVAPRSGRTWMVTSRADLRLPVARRADAPASRRRSSARRGRS